MSEHPILFTSEMVRAVMTCAKCGTITPDIECPRCGSIERLKTQTRRVIKPQPKEAYFTPDRPDWGWHTHPKGGTRLFCPYGKVGDLLAVKEGYQAESHIPETRLIQGHYLADNASFDVILTPKEHTLFDARKKPYAKTSGRFMYNSLIRLHPPITGIRVERVQEITREDAKAEGCEECSNGVGWFGPEVQFCQLWDSINAKRGFPWSDEDLPDNLKTGKGRVMYGNPWVWVIEFEEQKVE